MHNRVSQNTVTYIAFLVDLNYISVGRPPGLRELGQRYIFYVTLR